MAPSELLGTWLPHVPCGRVLDIGSGEGDVALWLMGHGFKVDAIEKDRELCVLYVDL